jgi:hypothetical protein
MFVTESDDLNFLRSLALFRIPNVVGLGDLVPTPSLVDATGSYLALEHICKSDVGARNERDGKSIRRKNES